MPIMVGADVEALDRFVEYDALAKMHILAHQNHNHKHRAYSETITKIRRQIDDHHKMRDEAAKAACDWKAILRAVKIGVAAYNDISDVVIALLAGLPHDLHKSLQLLTVNLPTNMKRSKKMLEMKNIVYKVNNHTEDDEEAGFLDFGAFGAFGAFDSQIASCTPSIVTRNRMSIHAYFALKKIAPELTILALGHDAPINFAMFKVLRAHGIVDMTDARVLAYACNRERLLRWYDAQPKKYQDFLSDVVYELGDVVTSANTTRAAMDHIQFVGFNILVSQSPTLFKNFVRLCISAVSAVHDDDALKKDIEWIEWMIDWMFVFCAAANAFDQIFTIMKAMGVVGQCALSVGLIEALRRKHTRVLDLILTMMKNDRALISNMTWRPPLLWIVGRKETERASSPSQPYNMVDFLVTHGAQVRHDYDAALRFAAMCGNKNVCKRLIDVYGADPHALDGHALFMSLMHRHKDVTMMLIKEYGVNLIRTVDVHFKYMRHVLNIEHPLQEELFVLLSES